MKLITAIIFMTTILFTGCSENENDSSADKTNISTSTKSAKTKLDKQETEQIDIQEELTKEKEVVKVKKKVKKAKKNALSSSSKDTFFDVDTKLMWQDNKDSKTMYKNWEDAKGYCSALTIGKYSDWRLPDYNELLSIVDYKKHSPAIKDGFKYVSSYYYWPSSENVSYSSEAWLVNFENGYTFKNHKSNTGHVRCVRG